jgi:hypothetical protein
VDAPTGEIPLRVDGRGDDLAGDLTPLEVDQSEPEPPRPGILAGSRADRATLAVFVATIFLGALLLFGVQPMVAKLLLPLLGGTPDVWNTATVFFQVALLGGYGWAHLTSRRLGSRWQPRAQLALLALPLLVLPIHLPSGWRPPDGLAPAAWTTVALAALVGLPFVALATTSPTLQRWFSLTTHPHAHDPYFLYAAGNAGSLIGLLAYPLVIEPRLDIGAQASWWAAGYVVFLGLSATCVVCLRRTTRADIEADALLEAQSDGEPAAPVARRQALRWACIAAIPSALMLGVTRYISTDVAAIPLLWVLPLALYLITFIVAFGKADAGRVLALSSRALRLLVIPSVLLLLGSFTTLVLLIPLSLATFFVAALVAHSRLAVERPPPAQLTAFFLWLSVGGAVGGALVGIAAPALLPSVVEYPVALGLVVFLAAGPVAARTKRSSRRTVLAVAFAACCVLAAGLRTSGDSFEATQMSILLLTVALAVAFVSFRTTKGFAWAVMGVVAVAVLAQPHSSIFADRTFFGIHRVYEEDGRHVLSNGTTVHGMQHRGDGGDPDEPLGYYGRPGPMGDVFATAQQDGPVNAGVIGLGTGALAAYNRPQDEMTFFEIDPVVADIAANPDLFSYLDRAEGDVDVVLGDGRLTLQESDQRYDVLVVDAFSSDAIPTHLLTDEAMDVYLDHVADEGVIVFHVSNRYFDLAPVLGRHASGRGLAAQQRIHIATDEDSLSSSNWVVVAPESNTTDRLAALEGWGRPAADGPRWTDSFTDLLTVLS